jgi:hypothetical protein
MHKKQVNSSRSAPKQPVELTLADGQNVSGGAPTLPLPPPRSERPDPVPWWRCQPFFMRSQ